jgi:hypothetical protein
MNKYLKEILIEMFRRVGAEDEFTEEYVKEKNWFYRHEWTEEEQDDYKKWLINYLFKNKVACKNICGTTTSKLMLKRGANMHMLNYGWKFKEKVKEEKKDSY